MVYVDTSAIVKLYVREEYLRGVSEWVRTRNESIPLTPRHELEFINARWKSVRVDRTWIDTADKLPLGVRGCSKILPAVQEQGHRAVVYQVDLHHFLKAPGKDFRSV